jgi:hypothetical protein
LEKQVDELKKELAQLGGKTAPSTAPATHGHGEPDVESMKAIFHKLLYGDDRQTAYVEATNRVSKCCPRCYITQAIGNDSCVLCGSTPKAWLPAEEETPDAAGRDAYDERRTFKRMSGSSSVSELKAALSSGWARTSEREEFATLLLALRKAQQIRPEPTNPKTEPLPAIPPHGITKQMIETALRACDAQLSELEGKQSTSGSVDVSKLKVPRFR